MSDDETLKIYAEKAADYEQVTQSAATGDPLLQAFLQAVPARSHLLDLGCGPGLFAAQMAKAGHRVTATDAVPEMVRLAAQYPGVTAQLSSFEEIAGQDIYDGIWANFSLLHADRNRMPDHLARLHTALKPGGIFHIALKTGEGSKRDALGRLYTYYSEGELSDLLTQTGFILSDRTTGRDKGLDGTYADWIALRAYG